MLLVAGVLAAETRVPVLVELFTSEGCSSCPPADELLRKLTAQPFPGAEVIALSEHVDYWNRLGWRDPFSAPQFSTRQQEYARAFGIQGPYTPQIVVDGKSEFVGSDASRLANAVKQAAQRTKTPISIAIEGERLRAEAPGAKGDLWLAIAEDGLETNVPRGENAGRRLLHDAVARRLVRIGKAPAAQVDLSLDPGWTRDHLSAIVFLQEGQGPVTGVARQPLRR